jgi:hypothetical protein
MLGATGASRVGMKWKWIAALLALLIAPPAALVGWAVFSPESPARYVAIIDELPVPSTWEAVHTDARGDFMGTRVDRYFLVDADPEDAVPTLKDVVQASGFTIDTQFAPKDWCDTGPLDASPILCPTRIVDECHANGPGGPISCSVQAVRDKVRLFMAVSPRGSTFDYNVGSERRHLGDPNRSLLRISAEPDRQPTHTAPTD